MAKRENGKERGYLWQELVEWYNGGKRKGTNIRRGSNGTAMMFAAKPMSKTTTREEGMIVCLGRGRFNVRYRGLCDTFARI